MSDWKVNLEFEEGTSSKFWRARVDGNTLYVNFGRIGSGGQTQVKELGSAAAAEKELAKLEAQKRKKGYEEAGGGVGAPAEEPEAARDEDEDDEGDEGEDEPVPAKRAAPKQAVAALQTERVEFETEQEGRKTTLELVREGAQVKTIVIETHPSAEAAQQAFARMKEDLVAEGSYLLKKPSR
jgi:predicted DNA-binding WGR domain protein